MGEKNDMKIRWLTMVFFVGLAACSVHSSKFVAPTGKKGFVITCDDGKDCYSAARAKCPEGYTNIASPDGEKTQQSGKKVVIECN